MVGCSAGRPQLPVSTGAVNGILRIQRKKNVWSPWEFCVRRSAMAGNIPSYPITRSHCPEGIVCTLKHKESSCPAAYHGDADGIYIGSRGKKGRHFTHLYRQFLKSLGINVGVSVTPVPVRLGFRPNNTVYISRPPSRSGACTTPIPKDMSS